MDSVDDLEYAEGLLTACATEELMADYCRPTCQAEGSGDPDACLSGDTCGCPCHDREDEGPNLGDCPYLRRDGTEGAYGPNTCSHGCSQEPECVTCEPSGGWPSWRRWAWWNDAEFHALVTVGLGALDLAGAMWAKESARIGMVDRRAARATDGEVLDEMAAMLAVEEWPGASGMEDIAELVALTGRDTTTPRPGVEWRRH